MLRFLYNNLENQYAVIVVVSHNFPCFCLEDLLYYFACGVKLHFYNVFVSL